MIQEINLYQPIFRKEKPVLHAVSLAYITLTCILVFFGLGWGLTDQFAQQQKSLAKQEKSREQLEEQLVLMQENASPKQKDPSLPVQIDRLARELESKRALLSRLSSNSLGQKEGFSALLAGLARQAQEGIWLTQVELNSGGTDLVIKGTATNPENIPIWLESLKQEPAFVGKEFNYVVLKHVVDVIEFSIATNRPTDLKNGAQQWLDNKKQLADDLAQAQAANR